MSTPVPPASGPPVAFPQYVLPKSDSVHLEGVEPKLVDFLAVLGIVHMALWQSPVIVTSARDQMHAANSAHARGKAVDVRVSDVPAFERDRLLAVVLVLCDRFNLTVFDERNLPGAGHFHVEVPE
jgi:hypothetical protein